MAGSVYKEQTAFCTLNMDNKNFPLAENDCKNKNTNLTGKATTDQDEAPPPPPTEAADNKENITTSTSPFHDIFENSPVSSAHNFETEGRDFTIEEILELGDDSLGLKVLVTAKQGVCLGVINIILTSCKKITLEKVSNPKTGRKKLGLRTFFFHDVLSIKVLGEDQEARQRLLKDIYFEKQQGKKLLRKKLLPIDLQEKVLDNIQTEEIMPGLVQELVRQESSKSKASASSPTPPPGRLPRPNRWLVIDVMGDAYDKAISMIGREMVISVGMTGLDVGRSGTLVWLSVATSSIVFLFDVAKLGVAEVMRGGLGAVLQDGAVVKVVHDCRPVEDLLHHQLNINLCNVFDTQVAEIYLHLLNNKGSVPLLVPSLPSLLSKYLSLDPQHLFCDGLDYSKLNESLWLERPLAESLGECLARTVMYLREVRLEQMDVMMMDLRQMTNIYLGVIRDKDSQSISQLEPQVVPVEVQKLGQPTPIKLVGGGVPFTRHNPKPKPWRR